MFAANVSFSGYVKSQQSVPLQNYWVFFRFSAPAYLPGDFTMNGPAVQTDNTGKYTFTLNNIPSNVLYSAKIYAYDSNFHRIEKSFSFFADGCNYYIHTIYANPITSTNTKVNFNHQAVCMDCPAYKQLENTSTPNLKNTGLTTWEWESNNEIISNDTHTKFFISSPSYTQITLTAKVTDPYTGFTFFENSETKEIVTDTSFFFHVGGQIFSGSMPVSTSGVILYRKILDDYQAIDTMIVSQYGYYYFTELPNCEYLLKAFPDPDQMRNEYYLPTYYPDVPYWSQAQIVQVQNHSSTMSIYLLPSQQMSGQYSIDGHVYLPDMSPVRCEIILLDSEMNVAQYALTSGDGAFHFAGLPQGTYYLVYEIPGIYSEHIPVTLSENNPVAYEEIIVGSATGSEYYESWQNEFSAFPNPFESELLMTINTGAGIGSYFFVIRDILGSVVYAGSFDTGEIDILLSLPHLNPGPYFLEIFNTENRTKQVIPLIKQ